MSNKKVVQQDSVNKTNPGVNTVDKKDTKNTMPENVAERKQKKPLKKSSALLAAASERSVVDAVNAHSSKDVRGSSGLANTGTIISYD